MICNIYVPFKAGSTVYVEHLFLDWTVKIPWNRIWRKFKEKNCLSTGVYGLW